MDKIPGECFAWPYSAGKIQTEMTAAGTIDQSEKQFHAPGRDSGDGGALHAQFGCAEFAENKHIVQKGIDDHGGRIDVKSQFGIAHAPLGPHIDLGEDVDGVGPGHNAHIPDAQLRRHRVIGEDPHQHLGEEEGKQGKGSDQSEGGKEGDAHHTAHRFVVTLAIILADEHAGSALKAKDHEHDDKKGGIDH